MKHFQVFRSCFLPLAALFLLGCEKFEPEGTYFKEITVKEPGQLQIKLNPAADTLAARGDTFFYFEVPEHVREEIGYRLYLGNQLLEENPYPPDMILFEAGRRQDGHYTLRLELFVKSNTGSLADKVGMEYFIYKYAWVLKIDNRPSSNYPIHQFTVTEEEGRIKLSWPKYDLPNFQTYLISRREVGGRERYKSIYIDNVNTTRYFDDAFVGGSYTYTLTVQLNEYPNHVAGSAQPLEAPIPQLLRQEQREGAFYIAWSSCLYPKNFEAYEIYQQGPYGTKLVYSGTRAEDTTVVLPAAFGPMNYQLYTKPRLVSEAWEGSVSDFSLSYGFPHSLPFSSPFLVGEKAYLVQSDDGRLTKYDGASLEPLLSRPFKGKSLTISDNGEYIYYTDGSHLIRLNPASLQEEARVSAVSLIGYETTIQHLAVNNQHQLLFWGYLNTTGKTDSMTLVDMNAKEVLIRRYFPEPYGGTLSNDGHFFLQGPTVLLDLIHGHRTILDGHAFWLPQGPSRLVYATSQGIVVMDPESRQPLKEIPTPGWLHSLGVDPLTGYVGGGLQQEDQLSYRIYNVETAELIKEIAVSTPYLFFRNNTLFSYDLYLPVSMP